MSLLDYFKKKFGPASDEAIGESYEVWNRDDETAGRVVGGNYNPGANTCPARYMEGRFNKRGIAGKVNLNLDYNVQDGRFISTDTLGRKHIVQEACDGSILGGAEPQLMYLKYQHRQIVTGNLTDVIMIQQELNDLYLGVVNIDIDPEATRGDYQVYVKFASTRFPFVNDASLNSNLDLKKNFVHNFPIPLRYTNKTLYARTSGLGAAKLTTFDVFVFSQVKPAQVTYTIDTAV